MDYSREIDKLRHSCSHIMAQAVKELWPDVKVTIGPAIESGFYYDFEKKESFTDQDLVRIEQSMQKIIDRNLPIVQELVSKQEALDFFRQKNETYKVELIAGIPDEKISLFVTGAREFVDLCKGPHVRSTGQIKAFKLLSVAGAYWHGDEKQPMLQRIYGTSFFSKEELAAHLQTLLEADKRDHRKLGTSSFWSRISNTICLPRV